MIALLAAALMLAGCIAVFPLPRRVDPGATRLVTLTGTLSYRQRIALPENAETVVQLVDTSDAPALVLAETRVRTGGRQVPIPFALQHDPARVARSTEDDAIRVHAALVARIESDGRLLFRTPSPVPLSLTDQPIELLLELAP